MSLDDGSISGRLDAVARDLATIEPPRSIASRCGRWAIIESGRGTWLRDFDEASHSIAPIDPARCPADAPAWQRIGASVTVDGRGYEFGPVARLLTSKLLIEFGEARLGPKLVQPTPHQRRMGIEPYLPAQRPRPAPPVPAKAAKGLDRVAGSLDTLADSKELDGHPLAQRLAAMARELRTAADNRRVRGRQPDPARGDLAKLIAGLALVFEHVTGRPATAHRQSSADAITSPFIRFANALFDELTDELQPSSRAALAIVAQEVLRGGG